MLVICALKVSGFLLHLLPLEWCGCHYKQDVNRITLLIELSFSCYPEEGRGFKFPNPGFQLITFLISHYTEASLAKKKSLTARESLLIMSQGNNNKKSDWDYKTLNIHNRLRRRGCNDRVAV